MKNAKNQEFFRRLLAQEHGLNLIMGPPVLVQLYIFESESPEIEISELAKKPKLPSDLMMDNLLLYGEFEIIGFEPLIEADFDFPISYGRSIDQRQVVFLQWGLIHRELPLRKFDKFLVADNPLLPEDNPSRRNVNPYGYYSIGFRPRYGTISILRAIQNDSAYDFSKDDHFTSLFDLRNPKNHVIKETILKAFGLDPKKSYVENCKALKIESTPDALKRIS